jgi:hypothetical protein
VNDLTHDPDKLQRFQLPPIGPEPDDTQLFLCAVMRSSDQTVSALAPLVFPDDLDPPGSTVYATALALAQRNVAPSPAFILDDLRRRGQLTDQLRQYLLQAVTTGADRMLLREHGAVIVAARLRALFGSLGYALSTGAQTVPESALPALAEQAAKQIRATADRLDILRGE